MTYLIALVLVSFLLLLVFIFLNKKDKKKDKIKKENKSDISKADTYSPAQNFVGKRPRK